MNPQDQLPAHFIKYIWLKKYMNKSLPFFLALTRAGAHLPLHTVLLKSHWHDCIMWSRVKQMSGARMKIHSKNGHKCYSARSFQKKKMDLDYFIWSLTAKHADLCFSCTLPKIFSGIFSAFSGISAATATWPLVMGNLTSWMHRSDKNRTCGWYIRKQIL